MRVPAQQARTNPPRLAFLAEAPGKDEIDKSYGYMRLAQDIWPAAGWGDAAQNRKVAAPLPPLPLVGASGQLFNAALRAADIDRAECWVGNIFEEKAPGNDVSAWLSDPVVIGRALERLATELHSVQPTVLVPMGATALQALTGASDISRHRGSAALATLVCPGQKIVPTYHPAFILRQWKHLPLFIGDLVRAAAEAEKGPGLVVPWAEFTLEPDLAEVRAWLPRLLSAPLLSVDIETGWGQITNIGFAPDIQHAINIPFVDLRRPSKSYWKTAAEECEAWQMVKAVLDSPVPKLGQNFGAYDAYWLLEEAGIRTMNLLHDTRLMHHALYPDLPKDLASLAAAYSDFPAWKVWNSKKEEKRDA